MMRDSAIAVDRLTKRFGSFVAVDDLSFSVARGEVFGFLGANGAGKSTTIRMLCGLLQPTSGTAEVAGCDIQAQTEQLKRQIGYMSQRFSLYNDLTVEQNIRFYGGVYGLRGGRLEERMQWVLRMADLEGQKARLAGALSGGWKQRLALGCAVLHGPTVVFLDEPTSGVDPIARRNFWALIDSISSEGTTVLVTTHFLEEAEYCNRIALIDAGRLVAQGSPLELKTRYITCPILEVACSRVVEGMEAIQAMPWATEVSVFGNLIHVMVQEQAEAEPLIARTLEEIGIRLEHIQRITPTLEDVFLFLLEKKHQGTGIA